MKEMIRSKEAEEAELKIRGTGKIKLIYERYDEEFPILDGCCHASEIDDIYCLSFVMPNCSIHLSSLSPQERRLREDEDPTIDVYIKEEPMGRFHNLEKDMTYYVYVEQQADQLARDQERMRLIALRMEGANLNRSGRNETDTVGTESCSCVFGNPCVDPYGCKDWDNRKAVAAKNGWKESGGLA